MATFTAPPAIEDQTRRPPAGWYPDPVGSANWLRYWNGTEWTLETALMALREPPAPKAEPEEPAAEETAEADDEAAADSATTASAPVGLPVPRPTPKRSARWARVGASVVCVLLPTAVFLAALPHHKATPRVHRKAAALVSHPAPAPLTVSITTPADGATVHTHSVLIKGVVSHSRARITVNGQSTVVNGHRFTLRLPLHLGYNEFDVSAEKTGLGAGMTSVSIVRSRNAEERAALLARRASRRSAAEQSQAATGAQHSGTGHVALTPTTSYGVGGSGSTSTGDSGPADADLELLPPKTAAPSVAAPAPAPSPAPAAPAEPAPQPAAPAAP